MLCPLLCLKKLHITWDYSPKGEDKDLAVILNALIPLAIYKTPHVEIERKNEKNIFLSDMEIIGTSFN